MVLLFKKQILFTFHDHIINPEILQGKKEKVESEVLCEELDRGRKQQIEVA